jgi:hypothetical protein
MKLTTRVVVPTAVAGVLAVGAAAIAWADSGTPTPTPSPGQSTTQGNDQGKKGNARGGRIGALERRALHGELVVPQRGQRPNQTGTVQTMVVDTQRGEITTIDKNAKKVTVKSVDGFTRTYVVNADTKIRSEGQTEAFTDLKVGERAMVLAQPNGSTFVALAIRCVHEAKAGSTSGSSNSSSSSGSST